jgi:hypothetical protein
MRATLWATVFWNAVGAVAFAFPASLGQLVGLPLPALHLYSWLSAFVIAVFGGVYAWLALQPEINRPLVTVAAIGKAGFFAIPSICWMLGEIPGRLVLVVSVDLAFAIVFASWLLRDSSPHAA